MNPRTKKIILLVLAALLLTGNGFIQHSMNADRLKLGITRVEPLKNAPPVLAFTTVALGGFRGLISNALWIRANELQEEDKFFEMAQLADWITKLEPHFVQVWLVQAWNMAYNISVKFKEYPDRWRWVQRGVELLRDQGLAYNPNELLMYRELAWFFQHKMGQNLDDASLYYKQQWANEMAALFGNKAPDLDEMINPQTPDAKKRAELMRTKYKLDPVFMKEVNERYGPLEWRLPESHAIYWAALGLRVAEQHPEKIKKEDILNLRRVIYQSMQMSFHRGRLVSNPFAKRFEFGPNLDIIPKVSFAYEEAIEQDPPNKDNIERAHRNFLKDAVYFLYTYNRMPEAVKWFKYLGTRYPDKPLLLGKPETLPGNISLDQYAVARVQEDIGETDRNRVQAILEGLLRSSYLSLALGEEDRYQGMQLLAQRVWQTYMSKIPQDRMQATGLRPLGETAQEVLSRFFDPQEGAPPEVQEVLKTRLNLPAAPTPPGSSSTTNSPAPVQPAQPAAK